MRHETHCPFCGSAQVEALEKETGYTCLQCKEVRYFNSKPSVAAIIAQDQQVLLVYSPSDRDDWDLPGGFLLLGEAPLDGLRRELKEELNVGIDIGKLVDAEVDTYGDRGEYSLNLFYEVTITSGAPQPSAEVTRFGWFYVERLPKIRYRVCVRGSTGLTAWSYGCWAAQAEGVSSATRWMETSPRPGSIVSR